MALTDTRSGDADSPANSTKRGGPGHRATARAPPAPDHGRHPLRRRTGIPRRYLPHDLAPWETAYGYFAAWQKKGVLDQLNGLLRRLVRIAESCDTEPSGCIFDAQSVKTSANVPAASPGIDAGKKIAGRTRRFGVDALGLLLAVPVTAASVSDRAGGVHVLSDIAVAPPASPKPGPRPATAPRSASRAPAPASTLNDPPRPVQRGFNVIARRWVGERTFGWLIQQPPCPAPSKLPQFAAALMSTQPAVETLRSCVTGSRSQRMGEAR